MQSTGEFEQKKEAGEKISTANAKEAPKVVRKEELEDAYRTITSFLQGRKENRIGQSQVNDNEQSTDGRRVRELEEKMRLLELKCYAQEAEINYLKEENKQFKKKNETLKNTNELLLGLSSFSKAKDINKKNDNNSKFSDTNDINCLRNSLDKG